MPWKGQKRSGVCLPGSSILLKGTNRFRGTKGYFARMQKVSKPDRTNYHAASSGKKTAKPEPISDWKAPGGQGGAGE